LLHEVCFKQIYIIVNASGTNFDPHWPALNINAHGSRSGVQICASFGFANNPQSHPKRVPAISGHGTIPPVPPWQNTSGRCARDARVDGKPFRPEEDSMKRFGFVIFLPLAVFPLDSNQSAVKH